MPDGFFLLGQAKCSQETFPCTWLCTLVVPNICFSHLIWAKRLNPRFAFGLTCGIIVWLLLHPLTVTFPQRSPSQLQWTDKFCYCLVTGRFWVSLWSSSFFSSTLVDAKLPLSVSILYRLVTCSVLVSASCTVTTGIRTWFQTCLYCHG